LQQEKLTGQDQQFEQLWCLIYIYVPATDNDRACSSSSEVGEFNERRPRTSASGSSLLKIPKSSTSTSSILKYWSTEEMYLLHVTDDWVFSTQRRVITHYMW